MSGVEVATVIDASPEAVWASIEDVASHVSWMHDATAIRFTTDQRRGVGTAFDCDTRVGPIRLTDRMAVTEWEPGRAMGVRHVGLVTGEGRFTLAPTVDGCTRFTWSEQLRFPWWLGGRLGAAVAGATVLRWIWQRNLAALKARVEQRLAAPPG